jgi:putative ABC transport system permease protein
MNLDEILEGQIRSYVTIATLMAAIVLTITGVIVFFILYFVIKTMISRRRRRFGVQKALGYTTYQIMQQIAVSFLPVSLGGSLIGVIMGCFGINPLMSALFKSAGIMRFEMIISYTWLGALCMGLVLLTYVIAMGISYRIRRISAYILVTE